MGVNIKIDVKDKELIEGLKSFAKELRTEMTKALDPVLDTAVDELRVTLMTVLDQNINVASTLPVGTKVPAGLNIPKTKSDLIKFIFNEDITKADWFQRSIGNKTVNDNSNVFVYDKGRIKNWQTVSDSSTYTGQESNFRERLIKGILIDAATGSMYKIHPDDVKGIKLECSKDTGETVNSEKKFNSYKNGGNIERRKFDAPYTRTAVWTIKQADAKQLVTGAFPLDPIITKIQEGDFATATELFTRNNRTGVFNDALERLEDIKKQTGLSGDLQTRQRVVQLINNLRIKKSIGDYTTKYTLFSSYDTSIEESEDKFFELMKQEIFLWKISNEDALFKALIKAADKVIKKYTSKG